MAHESQLKDLLHVEFDLGLFTITGHIDGQVRPGIVSRHDGINRLQKHALGASHRLGDVRVQLHFTHKFERAVLQCVGSLLPARQRRGW